MQAYCEHGCRQAAHERREQLRGVASLAEAITAATIRDLDGQKHSHQRRIKPAILEQANRTLQLHAGELAAAGSFHELFCLIEDLMQPITGIGALAVYDFTERIAGYLERAPSVVYLHAGTREGAKALGLDTPAGVLQMDQLPRAFQELTPAEAEDVLCIFKAEISLIRSGAHPSLRS